jgi:Zn-dependent M28 family amino/carboxypeptidase
MKFYLLVVTTVLLSCSSVNKLEAQHDSQLLKDLEVLSSDAYQGRKTGTKGAELARKYIIERFKGMGITPMAGGDTYEQSFSFNNGKAESINGVNIVAGIKGESDDVIVISAHYDHLGIINNEIYNGADDNASGVAALLKLAAYFKNNKPSHTLIFTAFDAEEMGLKGAKYFVNKPPVPLGKIKLNINMDMISRSDKGELYACGTNKFVQLKPFIHADNAIVKVLLGHDNPKSGHDDWTNQSDHSAFNNKDIPFIYFGVEDHKDYHKATDEFKNINTAFFVAAADAIQEIATRLDRQLYIKSVINEKKIMNRK